jgi:hypothetical protein
MRVRVSLDFDILIESFISLCIIETVGAIFREYKQWIVLLITVFVKKLLVVFSKEKATKKPIVPFDRVYQKTSKA